MKRILLLFQVIVVFTSVAYSQNLVKMHYPQPPEISPANVGVSTVYPLVIGDDWMCTGTGPITEIHIWGSFLNNYEAPGAYFTLQIWSDVPAAGQVFSHPGDGLWAMTFLPGQYTQTYFAGLPPPGAYFYIPTGALYYPNTNAVWEYTFTIPEAYAFTQTQGTIYWLTVQTYNNTFPQSNFGWSSSNLDYQDGATWTMPATDEIWNKLIYPPQHPYYPQSMNMAFTIMGPPCEACCFPDGSCQDSPPSSCQNNGGIPQGNGTTCATTQCPLPIEACCFSDGTCVDLPAATCTAQGGTPQGNGTSCASTSCPVMPKEWRIVVGDWWNPEPWHTWISGLPGDTTRVMLHAFDPDNVITSVDFYYIRPGQPPVWFYTDYSGAVTASTGAATYMSPDGDGWCGYFDPGSDPFEGQVGFMAGAHLRNEPDPYWVESFFDIYMDPTPPSSVEINIPDMYETTEESVTIDVNPGGADISSVEIIPEPKVDSFSKGIPSATQPTGTTCSPTAAAACLEYYGTHGYPAVTGGLTVDSLGKVLAGRCHTDQRKDPMGHPVPGTFPDDLANGLRGWINDNGGGFTVRGPIDYDWPTMRNELERCQDVLANIYWSPPATGGHTMTFNSVINTPLPNGKIQVDFMDPVTGEIETGELDPSTGTMTGFTGAGTAGTFGNLVIVCPNESSAGGGGGGTVIPGPDPVPIIVPLPNPGYYWIRIIIIDLQGNSSRKDIVVKRTGKEYGDAPENALAYVSPAVIGAFPTCKNTGPAGYIEHDNWGAWFGPSYDMEGDGNAGFCPTFAPNSYNMDECFGDGDAGLLIPGAYTIVPGLAGNPTVAPCPNCGPSTLGNTCTTAIWGTNVDILVHNNMPNGATGFVNVLFDWDMSGAWGGASACLPATQPNVPEHVLVNFPIPNGFNGPLSALGPPAFRLGPVAGFVWARFTITERPVQLPWTGEGIFEDGETEDYLLNVNAASQPDFDFGDAPDNYNTLLASNGARHITIPGMFMGNLIDSETDGFPSADALGDDNNNLWDEDGMIAQWGLTAGFPTNIHLVASMAGVLDAWMDFNADGDWNDAGEKIFNNVPLIAGVNVLNFVVPANAVTSAPNYARYRYTTSGISTPDGQANSGEVEDYRVDLVPSPEAWKWMQPPDQTLSGLHAHDAVIPGIGTQSVVVADDWLCDGTPITDIHWYGVYENQGGGIDHFHLSIHANDPLTCLPLDPAIWVAEVDLSNSQELPTGVYNAEGYMINSYTYFLRTPFQQEAGTRYWLDITAYSSDPTIPALWKWQECARSHVPILCPAASRTITNGILQPWSPLYWQNTNTYSDMAFALSKEGFEIQMDFGDAPDPTYPTLLASNGARHYGNSTLCLGATRDNEANGFPDANALGDDNNNTDDEDGVVFTSQLIPGQQASVDVSISGAFTGILNAWIDFNADGDWSDANEHIFTDYTVSLGNNSLNFNVPASAVTGNTFARFRVSTATGLNFYGFAADGEVEDYQVAIGQEQLFDFGDAPDPTYPTLLASNGARHIVTGLKMGALVDAEANGFQNATATGDDNNNLADEDGVWWGCSLVPGHGMLFRVAVNGPGYLNAWIDFNRDGDWADNGEHIFTDVPLSAGVNDLLASVPAWAQFGNTFARFRFSSQAGLSFNGLAQDGEVEDYVVAIQQEEIMDYGDAPDTYRTLAASGGPCHGNNFPGLFLGALIDYEMDGFPNAYATGDNLNNANDEDGIVFNTLLIPGQLATLTATVAMTGGFLEGWIDFNKDGDFADPGEHFIQNMNILNLVTPVNFNVPANAVLDSTFARFRYSTTPNLNYFGCALNGEVEDYKILIGRPAEFDFGDAPDPTYPTLLISNGARHIVTGLFMGALIDSEVNGFPNATATGDDNNNLADEDGVWWGCSLVPGHGMLFRVTVNGPGYLNAWMDFNKDGDWADNGEHIFIDVSLSAGVNDLSATVPAGAQLGNTFARFRFSSQAALSYTGLAQDGEVEDYQMVIQQPQLMDYGDAPDSYRTLASSNGPRHGNVPAGVFLGALVDYEMNGFPNAYATGDNLNNSNDEDGIVFNTPLIPGQVATLTATVSMTGGFLDGWIDFNKDGDFADAGEHFILNQNILNLVTAINFNVPANAVLDSTFARFRYSTTPNLNYFGCASNGEVEDYKIYIGQPPQDEFDFGDAPDPNYPTLLANNGARHIADGVTYLGNLEDTEVDGNPDLNATGDDLNNLDDEDGVLINWGGIQGNPTQIAVNASTSSGLFSAWIDYNLNGLWTDAGEQVFSDLMLPSGWNVLNFIVPNNAQAGQSFARYRYTHQPNIQSVGLASDGEVEDYAFVISGNPNSKWLQPADTNLPGLHSHDGADKLIVADDWICNGGLVTDVHWQGAYEAYGSGIKEFLISVYLHDPLACQPAANPVFSASIPLLDAHEASTGHTNNLGEMIYNYSAMLPIPFQQVAGTHYWISISSVSNNQAQPCIWLWSEASRSSYPVLCGAAYKSYPNGIPSSWVTIVWTLNKYSDMAFELTTSAQQHYFDYGDAPDSFYKTLLASNGARHVWVPTIYLGDTIDVETDGNPNLNATGDDNANVDDEDGVVFTSSFVTGQTATMNVKASASGTFLNVWFDFNADGDWVDAGEHIFTDIPMLAGVNSLNFIIPVNTPPGNTFMRFRLSTQQGLNYYGAAMDGEVEDYRVTVTQVQEEFDFGDAPDAPYPTKLVNNGARHVISSMYLGNLVDAEVDGLPQVAAVGDDINNLDDEDGVVMMTNMVPGQPAIVQVTASAGGGYLNAWMDFNHDGDWNDAGEQIFVNQLLTAGSQTLTFPVPASAGLGGVISRFRYSSQQGLGVTGAAPDGEVEDYVFYIVQTGPGKAHWPQYPDLAFTGMDDDLANAPSADDFLCTETGDITHVRIWTSFADDILPGAGIDSDTIMLVIHSDVPAGVSQAWSMPGSVLWSHVFYAHQYSAIMISDHDPEWWYDPASQWWHPANHQMVFQFDFDLTNFPFTQQLGTVYWLEVRFLHNAWHFDNTLGWKTARLGDRFNDGSVWWNTSNPGFPIGWNPNWYPSNHQYADVKFDLSFVLNPPQGFPFDFGDAPDPTYPTLMASNGARHADVPPGLMLGAQVDRENNGFPNAAASGDNLNNLQDEDGITFMTPLVTGQPATVNVFSSADNVLLFAWIDYNGDGDWSDANEQIANNLVLSAGNNTLAFNIPAGLTIDTTYMRFRLTTDQNTSFNGPAANGEVEDYRVVIQQQAVAMDYGDAPDPTYPTLLASDGARHARIITGVFLGNRIDYEADGLPDINATGDDNHNLADEDGVTWLTPLNPGTMASIRVRASINTAPLNAWMDFNADGDWNDAGEQIFTNQVLAAGNNNLNFFIPATATTGKTFARFRYSTMGNLLPTGYAPNGEVEDYKVFIQDNIAGKMHFPQYPDPFGWDVNMTYPKVVADDWMCTESGKLDDLYFWISYQNNVVNPGLIDSIHISVHADIPAAQSPTGYSTPGAVLWQRNFHPGQFTIESYLNAPQGWIDPWTVVDSLNHNRCQQVILHNIPNPFVQEQGTIYWLDVSIFVRQPDANPHSLLLDLVDIDPGILPYQIWTESGVEMFLTGSYGPTGSSIWLFPGTLHLDLSDFPGLIDSVEVLVTDACDVGCTVATLWKNYDWIDSASNTQTGIPEMLALHNTGMRPTGLTVHSSVAEVLDIILYYHYSTCRVGWKTSMNHWNDAAVFNHYPVQQSWEKLQLTPTNPLDMAFVVHSIPQGATLQGSVTYDNGSHTPMSNIKVYLIQAGVKLDSATTNSSGFYQFLDVQPGDYTLDGFTGKAFGGINSADALAICKHFVNLVPLTGLKLAAADVDGNGYVNTSDALMVAKRFIMMITYFPVGDWIFEQPSLTVTSVGTYTVDFKALCYGDVNGTYTPPAKQAPALLLGTSGNFDAASGKEVLLPFMVNTAMSVGSVSLEMDYPASLEVLSVSMPEAPGGGFVFKAVNGTLRISWYSLSPLSLSAGDVLMTVRLMVNAVPDNGLAFRTCDACEITDGNGVTIPDAVLYIPLLVAPQPGHFGLSLNIPNPFSKTTEISYSLPESGNVTLTVFTVFGEVVSSILDGTSQEPGTYKVNFDGSGLPSGVYIYRIEVDGATKTFYKARRMVLQR